MRQRACSWRNARRGLLCFSRMISTNRYWFGVYQSNGGDVRRVDVFLKALISNTRKHIQDATVTSLIKYSVRSFHFQYITHKDASEEQWNVPTQLNVIETLLSTINSKRAKSPIEWFYIYGITIFIFSSREFTLCEKLWSSHRRWRKLSMMSSEKEDI